MQTPVVGVVGLGILGRPVAEELLAQGIEVVVRDVSPAPLEGMAELGAVVASSSAEVGERSEIVFVLVQTADQCREVVLEVLSTAAQGTTVAVMATVPPDVVVELAAAGGEVGVDVIDAPFAGRGVESVRSHTMTVLGGGEAEVVERLRPAVEPALGRLVHAGPLGAGSTLKLAHNVMVYLGYLAVVEALELGHAAGVADGLVKEVTLASETLSPQSEVFLDIYERRRLDPGAPAAQAVFSTYAALSDKDLRHAVEVASAHGLDLPGARLASTMGPQFYRVDPAVAG
jgi:3-hydroxyisobutyrate dehydrogenase